MIDGISYIGKRIFLLVGDAYAAHRRRMAALLLRTVSLRRQFPAVLLEKQSMSSVSQDACRMLGSLLLDLPLAKRQARRAEITALYDMLGLPGPEADRLCSTRRTRAGSANKEPGYLVWGSITREKKPMTLEDAADIFGIEKALLSKYVTRDGTYVRRGCSFFRDLKETAYILRIRSKAKSAVSETPRARSSNKARPFNGRAGMTGPQQTKTARGATAQ